MFTLRDLCEQVTIQGNIRLSSWTNNDKEETDIVELRGVDYLNPVNAALHIDRELRYMFTASDGYLHIETWEGKA